MRVLRGLTPIVITPPAVDLVTLAEAKMQVNLEPSEVLPSDPLLELMITAACEWVKDHTNRAYYEETLRVVLDRWPSETAIELPRAPLQSISSVTWRGDDEAANTLDASTYFADVKSEPGRIVLRDGESWPSDELSPSGAISIDYLAGEAVSSPDTVYIPARVKMATLMLIDGLYRNRGAEIVGNPAAVASAALQFGVASYLSNSVASWAF